MRVSALGHKRTFRAVNCDVCFTSEAGIRGWEQYVCYGPKADIEQTCEMSADRFRRPNSLVFRIRGWRRHCSLTAPPPFQPSCQSR